MTEITKTMERQKKKAKPSGDSSHIYLPKNWEGDEILAINLDSSQEGGGKMSQNNIVYGAYNEEKARMVVKTNSKGKYKIFRVSEEMESLVKEAKNIIEKVLDKDNFDYANTSIELNINDYEVVSYDDIDEPTKLIDFNKKDIWE